jgi:hypothetical protein
MKMKIAKFVIIAFCGVILYFILSIFVKGFRFDLVNQGGGGTSETPSKEESIDRGVFVCDLTFASNGCSRLSASDVSEAWIERQFSRGIWYWTTNVASGYTIRINLNDRQFSDERLAMFRTCYDEREFVVCLGDRCSGFLRIFPEADTVKFNVMKREGIDYSAANIECDIDLIPKRRQ